MEEIKQSIIAVARKISKKANKIKDNVVKGVQKRYFDLISSRIWFIEKIVSSFPSENRYLNAVIFVGGLCGSYLLIIFLALGSNIARYPIQILMIILVFIGVFISLESLLLCSDRIRRLEMMLQPVLEQEDIKGLFDEIEGRIFSIKHLVPGILLTALFVVYDSFFHFVQRQATLGSNIILLISSYILIVFLLHFGGIVIWAVPSFANSCKVLLQERQVEMNPFSEEDFNRLKYVSDIGFIGGLLGAITTVFLMPSLIYVNDLFALLILLLSLTFFTMTFLVPAYFVHISLKRVRARKLKEVRRKMRTALRERRRLDYLINYISFIETKNMRKWPIDVQMVIQFLGTILLPIILLILDRLFG